jgi:hypothetical protein
LDALAGEFRPVEIFPTFCALYLGWRPVPHQVDESVVDPLPVLGTIACLSDRCLPTPAKMDDAPLLRVDIWEMNVTQHAKKGRLRLLEVD